ncbi:tetratricopeptide repeat protein, partial [Rothia dentocariosa]|uniref:tetratricopeptide repeat protein n=1 Tax=Rothia dentocariosa TaxID=2047 RepID=UPI00241E9725
AQAQYNLGIAYKDQKDLEQVIKAWSNINHDDPETYAQTRLSLGAAYYAHEDLDQTIKTWSKIHREEFDSKTYAQAQYNLGIAYKDQKDLDQAIKIWSNISHKDDPKAYTLAQLGLGLAYYTQNKLDEAITAWSKITRDEADSETYARAQLGLGGIYEDKGKIEQAKEAYRNARDFLYYKGERRYRILECPQEVIEKLHDIAKNTDEVLKSLQIIPEYESKVAHYSRASTAFSLFGDEKNDKEPSHFRLSTIRGVNDPTEGLVLNDYWDQQGIPETIHTNNTATFISCFTFNHDSLNQFRLYGKEDGREATGVSLVFNKEFFSDQSDDLKFIADPSTDPSSKSEQLKPNDTGKTESDNKKPLIGKSTLYRCIYLDPETGYWTLAQRDKSTFYREDKDKDTAENNWIEYSEKISEIEEYFKDYLFNKNDSILEKLKYIFKDV